MNEQRGEALSALLDGELDEAERKVLLDRLGSDEALRGRWSSYGLIRGVMRGEAMEVGDLAARVRVAIEGEPTVLAPPAARGGRAHGMPRWARPVAGLALAASLATVAVLGGRSIDAGSGGVEVAVGTPPAAVQAQTLGEPAAAATQPVSMTVGTAAAQTMRGVNVPERKPRWSVQQPAVQERLDAYLINHSGQLGGELRGMLPYARVVGYEGKQR